MPKATDVRIQDVVCEFETISFRQPMSIAGRAVDHTTIATVTLTAESRDGKKHAVGAGSVPFSNEWAWNTTAVSAAQSEQAFKAFVEQVVELGGVCNELGHPVDLVYHLAGEYDHLAKTLSRNLKIVEPIPPLAQLVGASAFDAALHDAFGRIHGTASYNLLGSKHMAHDLAEYLGKSFAGQYLDKYVRAEPAPSLMASHLVGFTDPLVAAEVKSQPPSKDPVPLHLQAWIETGGVSALRVQLSGQDLVQDIARLTNVTEAAGEAFAKKSLPDWKLVIDFGFLTPGIPYALELVQRIKKEQPALIPRILGLNQPVNRQEALTPGSSVKSIAEIVPVILDESLLDVDAVSIAKDLGYSVLAIRISRGQTESLLTAAVAQQAGMSLLVADLAAPSLACLQTVSLASRLPSVLAVESFSRQFCPGANKQWIRQFPEIFAPTNGSISGSNLTGEGLGF